VPPPVRTPPPRDTITAGMIDALAKTKPWVRFLSILGFVMVGLMLLFSLGVIGVGIFTIAKSGAEGAMLIGLGVLYLAMAVLYVFPSRFLWRYAKAIEQALTAQSKAWPIEQALKQQKSFWKFAGIMTLVILLLYIPGVLLAIAIPNLLTAMQRSKQKRTMADMRTIASAIEARATDVTSYPPPMQLADLAKLIEPKYVNKAPLVDGWAHPFQYLAACSDDEACDSYLIASPGRNGTFEVDLTTLPQEPETTKTFDDDIVFSNGRFLRYPEGLE
jgi:type II secretory pathway pseudopilin PulG